MFQNVTFKANFVLQKTLYTCEGKIYGYLFWLGGKVMTDFGRINTIKPINDLYSILFLNQRLT